MKRDEVLKAFSNVRVYQREGTRAVHKPLLILHELSRISRGEPAAIEYSAIEPKLMELLAEFGPSGSSKNRHYPFWHLQSDGFWQLHGPHQVLDRPPGAAPNINELRKHHISGELRPAIRDALAADDFLLAEVAQRIVGAHFPESIQQDVLDAVGLAVPAIGIYDEKTKRRRDPAFRQKVLRAYRHRCALCGHDTRLYKNVIGLEAAHIWWFQYGGPDTETNGLALCALHHKIFDLGAFTVRADSLEVQFSQHVTGDKTTERRLLSYHGAPLISPADPKYMPNREFLEWHREQVFKEPARD